MPSQSLTPRWLCAHKIFLPAVLEILHTMAIDVVKRWNHSFHHLHCLWISRTSLLRRDRFKCWWWWSSSYSSSVVLWLHDSSQESQQFLSLLLVLVTDLFIKTIPSTDIVIFIVFTVLLKKLSILLKRSHCHPVARGHGPLCQGGEALPTVITSGAKGWSIFWEIMINYMRNHDKYKDPLPN